MLRALDGELENPNCHPDQATDYVALDMFPVLIDRPRTLDCHLSTLFKKCCMMNPGGMKEREKSECNAVVMA